MSDTKAIRRYQAGVERALGLFDASNEWADYIAFLSRLLKALQASPTGADVPSKHTLARYLAQCLRPSLPSGVHQKALEAYGLIFNLLGKEGLSLDLPLFFPGLAHTLSFASLSTRPWFLTLFDDHILKLSSGGLRPALKAVLLSLLPGIEEESSEDFEKTLNTVNRVRAIFTNDHIEDVFWQSLFLACITSANRRMGVLVYLLRYMPKLGPQTATRENLKTDINGTVSVLNVTTPEPGLLVRCFACGLQDEQALIQRGFLDLLVTHFPLNSSVIQISASVKDIDIIVSAALSIVLKRDMGLNRRLWAWFSGADEKNTSPEDVRKVSSQDMHGLVSPVEETTKSVLPDSAYFLDFGRSNVIQTFANMLSRNPAQPSQRARPFRILVSLMDRTAIGAPIVDAMFRPLIADLKTYQTLAPSQDAFDEVFRSANVFFDSVDPRTIGRHLLDLFKSRQLDLLEFVITNFALDDDDLNRIHIPMVVCVMSFELLGAKGQPHQGTTTYSPETVARILDLLLSALPIHTTTDETVQNAEEILSSPDRIYDLYRLSTPQKRVSQSMIANADIRSLRHVISAVIDTLAEDSNDDLLNHLTSAFVKLRTRTGSPGQDVVDNCNLIVSLARWSLSAAAASTSPKFNIARNMVAMLASIFSSTLLRGPEMRRDILNMVPSLVKQFWNGLAPANPQYHVENVELIWTLRDLTADLMVVESTVMALLNDPATGDEENHPMTKFGVFWVHSASVRAALGDQPDGVTSSESSQFRGLLEKAALYVLDAADNGALENPYKTWLGTLSSLSFHYNAILNPIQGAQFEASEMATCLHRLTTLIPISKGSPSLWKEFTDDAGPCRFVLTTAMFLAEKHDQHEHLSLTALGIVRAVYEDSSYSAEDKFLETLSTLLLEARSGSQFQTAILETLQTMISLKRERSLPVDLLRILSGGIASPTVDRSIDKWITLLCNALPLYAGSVFFSNLLKLTDCLCRRIQRYFEIIKQMYQPSLLSQRGESALTGNEAVNPERSITNLLAGLEYILARAHTQVTDAARPASAHESNPNEASQLRSIANNRLTVVLCMQDAIKVCGTIWYWRPSKSHVNPAVDTKSFSYLSSRLRARSRRMLEHLTDAEPQECLETLMGLWVDTVKTSSYPQSVMNLLQTLEAARPKFMMPAIFNAIYNRTNPQALEHSQKSTLSVDITGLELLAFLIEYVEALEDDLLDEIWSNCTSFLRDILANPMPHRQLLLRLIDFTCVLCQKMENTTFGEQGRMRRELAELCTRLFTAVFTIKPIGFDASTSDPPRLVKTGEDESSLQRFSGGDGIRIYCRVLPAMNPILSEGDRISSIFSGVSTYIIGPLIKAKGFPLNVTQDVIQLLVIMSKAPNTAKIWRKDVLEAFNNQNFFQNADLGGELGWPVLVKQLGIIEKGLMPDMIGRLTLPTTAGIVFGVGAAAARTEADRQHRGNLRRISLLLLSTDTDMFVPFLTPLMIKLEELLTATQSSSPSSSTRSEIYLLLRAICLRYTSQNLVAIWPAVSSELQALFVDMGKGPDALLSVYSHLQGAKLLDLLLLLKPEEFQLHEWLFISDTIDAIYPPANIRPIASADLLRLDDAVTIELSSATGQGLRKPWLCIGESRKPEQQATLLGSFFSHLSIRAFEDTYSLEEVDLQACRADILQDLFSDGEQA